MTDDSNSHEIDLGDETVDDHDRTFVTNSAASGTRYAPVTSSPDVSGSGELSGQQIDDFRVLRTLGEGGMATVYLAEQVSLRRQVALKVMQEELLGKQASVDRFRTEAMAAAGLSHANIVQVYTVGESDGRHYIAMEYVPGRNLRQLVRRQGPLEFPVAMKIMRQATAALRAAGEAGIVHRDIKPANLLISRRGEVKIADFGLSLIADRPGSSQGDLTQTGQTVGTPRYMAPEQVEGKTTDHRSDLYSLGVTFYYLLAGRAPFEGESAVKIAMAHLKDPPPALEESRPDLPEGLIRLVHFMLEKEPADRPQSAAEVNETLRQITVNPDASGTAMLGRMATPPKGSKRKKSKTVPTSGPLLRRFAGPVAAAGLLGLLAGTAIRPGDPLRGGGGPQGVPKAASAEAQYVNAIFAKTERGRRDGFEAVIRHWRGAKPWTLMANEQLLYDAVQQGRGDDVSSRAEALESWGGDDGKLVADAARAALAFYQGRRPQAEKLLTGPLRQRMDELPPLWRIELENVRRQIEGE